MHRYFYEMRLHAFELLNKRSVKTDDKQDYPAHRLRDMLGFDDINQVLTFATEHGLGVRLSESDQPVVVFKDTSLVQPQSMTPLPGPLVVRAHMNGTLSDNVKSLGMSIIIYVYVFGLIIITIA